MTIQVEHNEDNTFSISWDENSPTESILNTWTEEDFIHAIMEHVKTLDNETIRESKDIL
jgi:hypothetical protein